MPYLPYRKRTLPQRPPAYGPKARRPKTVAATARYAYRLARTLAREVEPKVLTGTVGPADFFPAGNYAGSLVNISQGDGLDQRTGLAVNVKRIDMTVKCLSLTNSVNNFRVLVVQDLQTVSGTAPTLLQVLNTATTASVYNPVLVNRFKILYDQRRILNASFLNGDQSCEFNISLKGFAQGGKVEYNGAGATTNKNLIYMFIVYDASAAGAMFQPAGAANEAQYYVNSLTYFTDQ